MKLAGCGNQVKILDFGLACFLWDTDAATSKVGSVGYLPPKMFHPGLPALTTKVDCYCAGALLYMCLAGHGPFHGPNQKETLAKNPLNSVCLQGVAGFPKGARDLVLQLLSTKPEDRPTARQCLQHPWLACATKEAPSHATALAPGCLPCSAPAPGSCFPEACSTAVPARTDQCGAHSSSREDFSSRESTPPSSSASTTSLTAVTLGRLSSNRSTSLESVGFGAHRAPAAALLQVPARMRWASARGSGALAARTLRQQGGGEVVRRLQGLGGRP
ncbi:unnamed protein product [Prorocentrum cordatum]|uniref:Protein kinase domain-containing protein n=1 Tax=Prorocentrum cordatum TaxID=2364126 RepID=A0ABN9U5D0_9DINO|nr:unnamed protein product [Polarella glacialis]